MLHGGSNGSDQGRRWHRGPHVQHAAAAWHIEHVLIEIPESDRRTVGDDPDDLEHHAAISHQRRADGFGFGRQEAFREAVVDDHRCRHAWAVAFDEFATPSIAMSIVLK